MEKHYSGNGLKIIHFVQTWLDVKKLETDCQTRFWNYKRIGQLKIGSADFLLIREFNKKILDSKGLLKMYSKSSMKNPDFESLPLPSKPVWLKNDHL